MSDIRFNQWLHQSGTGGVSQSDGGHVGIGTTNPLIPVGAGNTHILNVGVVTCNNIAAGSSITAGTFYGSGANLSSLNVTAIKSGGSVKAQANADGVFVTGILTATNFKTGVSNLHNLGLTLSSGQLDIGSNIKAGSAGVITATSFSGSGANLTGIDATAIKFGGAVKAQANAAGVVVTGILTASAFKLADGSNVGGVESDGSQNTVGGTNAGDSIISGGTENTVFGYNAGTAISNGDGNTFIGALAGRSVSTGLSNTGVGYNVMGNASGNYNAALGEDAGNGMGDGRWHVAIGKGAFANTNQLGSQQNNIVIGYLADVSSSTVSNEMTLGNTNINHVRIPGIGCSISAGGAVISGVVTATSFSGSGANLTNLPSSPPPNNFLINGAMQVNVRGTNHQTAGSFNPVTSSIYTLDRWKVLNANSFDTDSAKVVQDNTAPTSEGFSKSIMMNIGNTETPGTNHVCGFQQMIEAQNLQSLAYGTSSAKTMTLSFWVYSNKTGTYCVQLIQDDANKYVLYEYTISSSNTWEKKTITIAGNTADAINNDNGIGFYVNWILCCGSGRHVSATSSWTSGSSYYATSNQVNLWDHPDNYFKMTGCQLQTGSTATDFVHEDIGTTLRTVSYTHLTLPTTTIV